MKLAFSLWESLLRLEGTGRCWENSQHPPVAPLNAIQPKDAHHNTWATCHVNVDFFPDTGTDQSWLPAPLPRLSKCP